MNKLLSIITILLCFSFMVAGTSIAKDDEHKRDRESYKQEKKVKDKECPSCEECKDRECPSCEECKDQVCPECPDPVCPECPDTVTKFLPSPGNAHGVNHGERVKREGVGVCRDCHNGKDSVVAFDKFICAQYDFVFNGRKVADGNGGFVKDPMSGDEIVSGGGIAVLLKGDIITCKMCHYPHATPGFRKETYLIHQGCLDCHVTVGSGEVKDGVDGDTGTTPTPTPTPTPGTGTVDPTGFIMTPWQNLCSTCHSRKTWNSGLHDTHAKRNIACTKCHTLK